MLDSIDDIRTITICSQFQVMEACEMSLLQHVTSLLYNLQKSHIDSLFSDLQIFCDNGVISFRI